MAVRTLATSPLKQKVCVQQVLKVKTRANKKKHQPLNPAVVTSVSPDRKPCTEILDVRDI